MTVKLILTPMSAERTIVSLFDHKLISQEFCKECLNKLMRITDIASEEFNKLEAEINSYICGR